MADYSDLKNEVSSIIKKNIEEYNEKILSSLAMDTLMKYQGDIENKITELFMRNENVEMFTPDYGKIDIEQINTPFSRYPNELTVILQKMYMMAQKEDECVVLFTPQIQDGAILTYFLVTSHLTTYKLDVAYTSYDPSDFSNVIIVAGLPFRISNDYIDIIKSANYGRFTVGHNITSTVPVDEFVNLLKGTISKYWNNNLMGHKAKLVEKENTTLKSLYSKYEEDLKLLKHREEKLELMVEMYKDEMTNFELDKKLYETEKGLTQIENDRKKLCKEIEEFNETKKYYESERGLKKIKEREKHVEKKEIELQKEKNIFMKEKQIFMLEKQMYLMEKDKKKNDETSDDETDDDKTGTPIHDEIGKTVTFAP